MSYNQRRDDKKRSPKSSNTKLKDKKKSTVNIQPLDHEGVI